MGTVVIQQFLNFFQDFIELCQTEDWPNDTTTDNDIKNAFMLGQHVQKCLCKLQEKQLINEFLSTLLSNIDNTNSIVEDCLDDPPLFVLKKILLSHTHINHVNHMLKLYMGVFPIDKVINDIANTMTETAAKSTLMSNLLKDQSKDRLLKFKTKVLLSEIMSCDANDSFTYNESLVEILVVSLLNKETKYMESVKKVEELLIKILTAKDNKYTSFWRMLFKVDDRYLLDMCSEYSSVSQCIFEGIDDCGQLLMEGMSTESFYIDFTEAELKVIIQRLCSKEDLKTHFLLSVGQVTLRLTRELC